MSAEAVVVQQYRGDGTTTRQMKSTPRDGVFVWCNRFTDYPERLKRHIGRDDIKVVDPDWLTDRRWGGLSLTGIVLDHATSLTHRQWDALQSARIRVRP